MKPMDIQIFKTRGFEYYVNYLSLPVEYDLTNLLEFETKFNHESISLAAGDKVNKISDFKHFSPSSINLNFVGKLDLYTKDNHLKKALLFCSNPSLDGDLDPTKTKKEFDLIFIDMNSNKWYLINEDNKIGREYDLYPVIINGKEYSFPEKVFGWEPPKKTVNPDSQQLSLFG